MTASPALQNYFFVGTRLAAVLDWEMSCLGRAEADLALQCLSNRIFAAPPDSGLLQPPSEDEWLAMYRAAGGRRLRNFDYFKKFAAYMIIPSEVLNAAVHATHGLIDSTSMWPEKSLRTARSH